MNRRRVRCPYCFHEQFLSELKLRCPPRCAEPQTFTAEEIKETGNTCPHGQRPDVRKRCADCEEVLPVDYLELPGRLIALVGSASAGKSTYVGVLLHELEGNLGARLGNVGVEFVGDISMRMHARLIDPLYNKNRTPDPTPQARLGRLQPIFVVLRHPSPRGLKRLQRESSTSMVLYDTAGEDVSSGDNIQYVSDHLAFANGVMMILDAAALADPETRQRALAPVQIVRDHLRENQREDIPLAVVLTKIDTLFGEEHFHRDSAVRRPGGHTSVFDEDDSLDVHQELRAWLDFQGLGNLDRTLQATAFEHRYFGVSALGQAPTDGRVIAEPGIQPHRIEDPLLWLLSRPISRRPRR